jgi:glutamate racemase
MEPPGILVFDSGLGGLTVYREIVRVRPDARFVYVADDAYFPYSSHTAPELCERVMGVMTELIADHSPDLVVIACNTASTVVLPGLRARFEVPFVGTVPAIKPACAGSETRLVSVLGTTSTVEREYTRTLIRDFASDCQVTLVGSDRLAPWAESELAGLPLPDTDLAQEIAPCFVEAGGKRTDTVVLACTHFPLLAGRLRELAPWPVRWLDPAEAIARRVIDLIGSYPEGAAPGTTSIRFTSGKTPAPGLQASLERFGL